MSGEDPVLLNSPASHNFVTGWSLHRDTSPKMVRRTISGDLNREASLPRAVLACLEASDVINCHAEVSRRVFVLASLSTIARREKPQIKL